MWQIGTFDGSSSEFSDSITNDVSFRVGQNTPKDWPMRQSADGVGTAGHVHTNTVSFTLPERPHGSYRLTLSVIRIGSRFPNLLLGVNGNMGKFYLDPVLSYYPGGGGFDSPIYSVARSEISVPERFLRTGDNSFTFTTFNDPQDGNGNSAFFYDGIRLTQNEAPETSSDPQIRLQPTVFYMASRDGLVEEVDAIVRFPQTAPAGIISVRLNGRTFVRGLASGEAFGEERVEFLVPQFEGAARARITVGVSGKTHVQQAAIFPKRKWTLFVVPNEHLDLGYTDYLANVAQLQNQNVDNLLVDMVRHPEFRFSFDGSWMLAQYLAARDSVAHNAVLESIRRGRLAVPAQYANLLTGYASLEVLLHSVDYSNRMHREAGLPFDYANLSDVPSASWSYASILHALGITYLATASNGWRSLMIGGGRWNELSPFWWQGPDGSRVLMSSARQYTQFLYFVCGTPPTQRDCHQGIPTFLQQYDDQNYLPDVVLMYGTQAENVPLVSGLPEFVAAWNARYAYPKLTFATFPMYLRYVDKRYGPRLATVTPTCQDDLVPAPVEILT